MSYYACRRDGELPGMWFVNAFEALGFRSDAIRQALYRMERSLEVDSRASGRTKYYRLSPLAEGTRSAGLAKLMESTEGEWDQRWTMILLWLDRSQRAARDGLLKILDKEGFATLSPGVHIHPRARHERFSTASASLGLRDEIEILRVERIGGRSAAELVDDLWNLPELSARYEDFIRSFCEFMQQIPDLSDSDIFLLRLAMVLEYLTVAWDDPELPEDLLPCNWAGYPARKLATQLYQACLPGAIRFADAILSDIEGVPIVTPIGAPTNSTENRTER